MRPNIFNIATKELNQDAFITWLLQWAEPKFKEIDEKLNLCAQDFVKTLISKQYDNITEITKIRAGRQWENIDIWAEINNEYLLIIEDKTFTQQHSNQLETYKENAENWCKEKNFKLVCVYLKTGSEPISNQKIVEQKGFKVFARKDFLELLNNHNDINNNIFVDFKERLQSIELAYNSFETKLIKDWDDSCWIGFYQYLETARTILSWELVNNPAGGFWNALLNWHQWTEFPLYMQIEQGNLCFKMSTHPEDINIEEDEFDRSEIRNKLSNIIINSAGQKGLNEIVKPSRFGHGKYMTVAIVNKQKWLGADNSFVDKNEVVNNLAKYEKFLLDTIDETK